MKRSEFENRNFGLDLLRCIAVFAVLITHGFTAFIDHGQLRTATYYLATYGVDLFFVLSGFLIGSIIIKINNRPEKTTFKLIINFWIRRWFRTLPNYYLFLLVYLLFNLRYGVYIPFSKLPLYILFLQNVFNEPPAFYVISWSLTIEEWFYLLFPIVLLLVQYFVIKKKFNIIMLTIIFFIIACLTLRIAVSIFSHRHWEGATRMLMPVRLDSIAFGVLAAVLKFYKINIWENYKNILAAVGSLLFISVSLVFYYSFLKNADVYGAFFMNTFFFTFVSFSMALMLPFFYSFKINSKSLVKYSITYISLISYSIYLVHVLIISILKGHFANTFNGFTLFFILIFLSIVVSHFNYNFFEKRITALRDKFGNARDVIHV